MSPVINSRDWYSSVKQTKSVSVFFKLFHDNLMQSPKMTEDEHLDRYVRYLEPAFTTQFDWTQTASCEEAVLISKRYGEFLL